MRNRFRTLRVLLSSLGSLLMLLGAILLVPIAIALVYREFHRGFTTLFAFLVPSLLCFGLGVAVRLIRSSENPDSRDAMLICALAWICFSAIGALPFVIGVRSSYLDEYFETMSGFTTTGITMYTGLDTFPKSILFWRSLTQWLGGLGILTFFLAVTYRAGSAHQLFGAESHKIDVDRPVPGLFNTVKILWALYSAYTVFIAVALIFAGMSVFDSFCHSFTALSTGGFSPHDASIEYYRLNGFRGYIWMEYILTLGMVLGGTNFLIHYRLFKREFRALIDNVEMRYWWALIGAFVLLILAERVVHGGIAAEAPATAAAFRPVAEENFRITLFQVVSILTTTGFGTRPNDCVFVGIYREASGDYIIPRGDSIVQEGDVVFIISKDNHIHRAAEVLLSRKRFWQ